QIQLQPAAHGADHVGLQIRVDEVLKVRQAVLGCHVKQQIGVGAVPVEVTRDVVGGNRKGEGPAHGIALHHDFDVGTVDQVHLGLQIAICEGGCLAAN